MSVVGEERTPAPGSAVPDAMPGGIALSVALHLLLGGVLLLGLPTLFRPTPPEDMPIAVSLVTVGPETRATHPNPFTPRPEAKPEIPTAEAPPLPEPKPEPAPPAPVAPPSVEAPPSPPAPPLPEPKPEPPKPAAVPPAPLPKPPEPKPEPVRFEKPEPPKPKPKPEPPLQAAKAEPKPEAKRYDPSQFQSLLKNLAMTAAAPPEKPRPASARPSSQPKAPLGAQLTTSEMDLVREQIARCWNVPAGARDAKDLVVEIRVAVDPGGNVLQANIVDQGRAATDPFFRAAAESARRAFFNPSCRPLRLPPEKYAIWKDLVVNFSPRDVL